MDGPERGEDPWGPFGAPLFQDPKARALARVGVIDVGSNSVRLVVFDGAARSPAYFYNEKILCGLGTNLTESGVLHPEGRARALAAIKRFAILARAMDVSPLTAVATAAVREARDGAAFVQEVQAATGLRIWIIEGEQEARFSAQGVLLGWPQADGLVCDIGGSSMELAELTHGHVGGCKSAHLGPLKLEGLKGGRKARATEIDATLQDLRNSLGGDYKTLFLVGGSWRAIARIDMERRGYPLHVLHEYMMRPADLRATAQYIALQDLESLRQRTGTSAARMALVPIASEVLLRVLHHFKPKAIAVSGFGIREGLLYEQMPPALRQRDPLIEACRFAERKDARLPGFGRTLFRFIYPLFDAIGSDRKRIIKAACLLHDVSWRAHPDYRADVGFDNATRANLGGLSHSERVFLGLSLLYRYRNKRAYGRFDDVAKLLGEKETVQAEILGKAMRFGAMFSALDPKLMGKLDWAPKRKLLTLTLPAGEGQDLFGEVAQARFASLAESLGAKTEVKVAA
jgi:exopolyphosphatase/guanosine-5'-triphosphate,3'-diphosphate pyrophosphatase